MSSMEQLPNTWWGTQALNRGQSFASIGYWALEATKLGFPLTMSS